LRQAEKTEILKALKEQYAELDLQLTQAQLFLNDALPKKQQLYQQIRNVEATQVNDTEGKDKTVGSK